MYFVYLFFSVNFRCRCCHELPESHQLWAAGRYWVIPPLSSSSPSRHFFHSRFFFFFLLFFCPPCSTGGKFLQPWPLKSRAFILRISPRRTSRLTRKESFVERCPLRTKCAGPRTLSPAHWWIWASRMPRRRWIASSYCRGRWRTRGPWRARFPRASSLLWRLPLIILKWEMSFTFSYANNWPRTRLRECFLPLFHCFVFCFCLFVFSSCSISLISSFFSSSRESLQIGWQLMAVYVVSFPPSKNFEQYLVSFLQKYPSEDPKVRLEKSLLNLFLFFFFFSLY